MILEVKDELSGLILTKVKEGMQLKKSPILGSKKYTEDEILSIVSSALIDALTVFERRLKVRSKP